MILYNRLMIYQHFLRYVAIAGNAVYILWIVHNAIDEKFTGRPLEIVVLVGLLILLTLNSLLLIRTAK